MLELYTFALLFLLNFLSARPGRQWYPLGACGLGDPARSGPGALGSTAHPVAKEMGLGGCHKDTGEHAASVPVPPSAFLFSFSFVHF